MSEWLSDKYLYRRPIRIAPYGSAIPKLHPVTVQLPKVLRDNNKLLPSFEDLEVSYKGNVVYRDVLEDGEAIYVTFQAQEAITGDNDNTDYHIYTGNYTLSQLMVRSDWQVAPYYPDPFEDSGFSISGVPGWANWPNSILYNDTLISYTRPGEHWKEGYTEVPQARASTKLVADRFRLICEVGPDQGIIQARVNDRDWQEIDLYSDERKLSPVFVSIDNPRHQLNELTVIATGRSKYPSQPFKANVQRIDFNYDFEVTELGEDIRPISWSSYVGGVS